MKKIFLVLLICILNSIHSMEINGQLKHACDALELLAKKFPSECALAHLLPREHTFCKYIAWDMEKKLKQCRNQKDITKFHPDYRICILEEKAMLLKNVKLIMPRVKRCIEKIEL